MFFHSFPPFIGRENFFKKGNQQLQLYEHSFWQILLYENCSSVSSCDCIEHVAKEENKKIIFLTRKPAIMMVPNIYIGCIEHVAEEENERAVIAPAVFACSANWLNLPPTLPRVARVWS